MTRYTVRIESDEDGFTMIVGSEIDPDRYRFPLESGEALYNAVRAEVRPWIIEREEAQRAYQAHVGAFHCDPDESAGMAEAYELSDPKHPDFHSIHADIWDMREGK